MSSEVFKRGMLPKGGRKSRHNFLVKVNKKIGRVERFRWQVPLPKFTPPLNYAPLRQHMKVTHLGWAHKCPYLWDLLLFWAPLVTLWIVYISTLFNLSWKEKCQFYDWKISPKYWIPLRISWIFHIIWDSLLKFRIQGSKESPPNSKPLFLILGF